MHALAKTSAAILSALVLFGLAPSAEAQSVGIHYSKETPHGHFGLSYTSGHGVSVNLGYTRAPAYRRVAYAPPYAPAYCPPPQPRQIWVPGSYHTVNEKVWVPGCQEKVWVSSVYATHYDPCGRPYQVLVEAGHWQVVEKPGHWSVQPKQVWTPGHWQTVY